MKVYVKRPACKDTQVTLDVYTDLDCALSVLEFRFETGHQYVAQLLARHAAQGLESTLAEIREKAYGEGWKDAKAKRRAKKQFCETWNPAVVGW